MNTASSNRPDRPDDSWADRLEPLGGGVVGVVGRCVVASGWAWGDGTVVTTAAGLRRGANLRLMLPDGEAPAAEVAGLDERSDLALLRAAGVPAAALPMVPAVPRLGDALAVLGRLPSGVLHASFGHTGLVGPRWRTWRGAMIEHRIRLDGGLFAGLPGGPVVDAEGRVIGLASAALSRVHGTVIPAATVHRVAHALLHGGHVPRAHLGVALQGAVASMDGTQRDGLLVTHVAEQGAAAAAGLLVGDLIVEAGGRATPRIAELREALDQLAPGATLTLTLARGGKRVDVDVAPWPAADA